MTEVLVAAFKRCGFDLAEECVQIKLQDLLESLDVDPSWAAKHYEIFQTRYTRHQRRTCKVDDHKQSKCGHKMW
jgi:hypothetical protein